MSRKRKDAVKGTSDDSLDHLKTGSLTWFGLGLATVGWVGLIGETTVVDILPIKLSHPINPSLHSDLVDIAMCVIGSGFALSIVGALQSGFGALNRFFEAVLMRSSQRSNVPAHVEPEPPVSNGRRPYRILADGSVEVETIVGTRRFDSLAEARDFI